MDEPSIPPSPEALVRRLRDLRDARRALQEQSRGKRARRKSPRGPAREVVRAKTGGRCHICGGTVVADWEADHVLAHAGGGSCNVENYLPAHSLCNNYRSNYSAEEVQWMLKIGVWARMLMEGTHDIGGDLARRFHASEQRRERRRAASGPNTALQRPGSAGR